jgi:hypothetical protein
VSSMTSDEILKRAMSGGHLSKDEVLKLYADSANWESHYNGPNGSHQYVWKGPVICAWEAARWALEYNREEK